jgi:hypothetical protein
MVALHGLQQLRGCLELFLPKRKEVAQSAPDLQMFVGRGQIERELLQVEGPRLGTLTLKPPLLPPCVESMVLLALPLLGVRAGAFSRAAGVAGFPSLRGLRLKGILEPP